MNSPKLEMSLAVSKLEPSVAFYRVLFGAEPVEQGDRKARFTLLDSSTEFELVERDFSRGGAMNHLGLRLTNDQEVAKVHRRLNAADIATNVEHNSLCGYARQNKVWTTDPDGHSWEIYTVQEDVSPGDASCGACGCDEKSVTQPFGGTWQKTPTERPKIHFGLSVANLKHSVRFYRQLLNLAPAKDFGDYAKFEIADPPLMFSLGERPPASGGALNHVAFRVTRDQLLDLRRRLREMGGTGSCDSDAVSVIDPDHVTWHFVPEDYVPATKDFCAVSFAPAQTDVWSHHLSNPFPHEIMYPDGKFMEVRLSGTFNARESVTAIDRLLKEVRRILAPEGKVVVTALVADRPFPGEPQFPSPAAQIERVPLQSEPAEALSRAGFVQQNLEKLAPVHCLDGRGTELFSLVLTAQRDRG